MQVMQVMPVTRGADGFSLIEMIVALSITLTATAGVFALMLPARGAFAAQSEASDMQQRLRVVADTLVRDLGRAGAGAYAGATGGPLVDRAPVLPFRAGAADGDRYTIDGVTIYWAAASGGQPAGATYWLRDDAATGTAQLMMSGDGGNDVPVIDHIVGLSFQYFGDPQPPLMRKPLTDPVGPWTTYGPVPSAAIVAPFAAGENCVFISDGSLLPQPRLPTLGAAGAALVRLTPAQLTDGPWCPDESAAGRWDADLLRVRRIAVTVRLEAAVTALRGPAGLLFVHGGTSRGGASWVPDLEARFEVTPRNLNLGR
ncbi:MAG: prepilin-type N-terminal cleavage/methylation domain-containing protein [Acidobacteria bacterium]|nr:prepilin-type N-terminal cleavage/methylation domain-containing protein [Acidobacteriota bacterium]